MPTIGERKDVIFNFDTLVLTLVGWKDWCPPNNEPASECVQEGTKDHREERKPMNKKSIKKTKKKKKKENPQTRMLTNLKRYVQNYGSYKSTGQLRIK